MNKALLAVAGSGKTESIVQNHATSPAVRRLHVTYTLEGQDELKRRLSNTATTPNSDPEVIGWYGFLIQNFLKPYLSDFDTELSYSGFNFRYRPHYRASRAARYFDSDKRVGPQLIAYVANKICTNNNNAPIERLENIYEEIVFDEVQDLAASDLDILERLLKSNIDIYMVGDIRQTVFETNTADRKHSQFRGVAKLNWFKYQQEKGTLSLKYDLTNRRSVKEIVDLSNEIFDSSYELKPATSGNNDNPAHKGLFKITKEDIEHYVEDLNPLLLSYNVTARRPYPDVPRIANFGEVKGLTTNHVLIIPTENIKSFLRNKNEALPDSTASKLYVAITRARYSVGFIIDDEQSYPDLKAWKRST